MTAIFPPSFTQHRSCTNQATTHQSKLSILKKKKGLKNQKKKKYLRNMLPASSQHS